MLGAQVLAQALARLRAGPVFTLSGNQILPIYDAGLDAGLRFVDTRHEAAAAAMADGWGRLTGQPGVCLVAAGPGFTNALTSIAAARLAESPVLFLSGGTSLSSLGRGGFQELDQLALARPLCTSVAMAATPADIAQLVGQAWHAAQTDLPGPVHITVPSDVLLESADDGAIHWPSAGAAEPSSAVDQAALDEAVRLLRAAERPVVLAGPSAWRGETGQVLRAWLAGSGLPGYPLDSARGLTDPVLYGVGPQIRRADVVVLIGLQDFVVSFGGPPALDESAQTIHLAPRPEHIGANRPVGVGLVGQTRTTVAALRAAMPEVLPRASAWSAELASLQAANRQSLVVPPGVGDSALHPLEVIATIRARLQPGDCVVLDGGEFGQWARWGLADGPFEVLTNSKLGGIGSGLSLAMAAALARPGRRCVAFVGDGTFGFHGLEVDTAVRHRLPLIAVVGNDAGWASERHRQVEWYGADRLVAADLLPSRYDLVASALGAHGELVSRADELGPAVDRALSAIGPACLNVHIASIPSPAANH